jgi:hypothetical protein
MDHVVVAREECAGRMLDSREPGAFVRGFRAMLGLVYFFGSPTHVYFALENPKGYRDFSEWAPPTSELSRDVWAWFLSNAQHLALLIAAFELVVAVLIFYGGRATTVGLSGALGFHLTLAAMFGMWPYTLPMILLIGWTARFGFERVFKASRRRSGAADSSA